nr:lipocalin family protein [Nereida sp. MMG025]
MFAQACTPPPQRPFDPVDVPFRNPTAQIASQSDVTLDRLTGTWRVTQRFDGGLSQGLQTVIFDANGIAVDGTRIPLRYLGEGRFEGEAFSLWVHWMDIDSRTAVIGSPDGDFGWIMERGAASADRTRAAREILQWYGYDTSRLKGV